MAATTTTQVTNAAWTSLGAGPLALQAAEGEIFVQVSATSPAGPGGFVLRREDGRRDFNTTVVLWVMSAATSGSGTVISAPMTA